MARRPLFHDGDQQLRRRIRHEHCSTIVYDRSTTTKENELMAQNTFHVALYVSDLDAAIARYRKLLGQEPAKVRHDYAKFEIADPPVILSLSVGGEPGRVSHLGIRYPSTGDVASELARTKREEVDVLQQQGTTCCYAKADKFWIRDADGVPWEMYTLLEDVEAETAADSQLRTFLGQAERAAADPTASDSVPAEDVVHIRSGRR